MKCRATTHPPHLSGAANKFPRLQFYLCVNWFRVGKQRSIRPSSSPREVKKKKNRRRMCASNPCPLDTKKVLLPLDHHGIGDNLKYVYNIYKIRCPRNARFRGAMGGFAAAHRRCLVGISARVLLVVPVPVPVLVPVVLLAPLVCDSTNRAENTSLPIYGSVQKYT